MVAKIVDDTPGSPIKVLYKPRTAGQVRSDWNLLAAANAMKKGDLELDVGGTMEGVATRAQPGSFQCRIDPPDAGVTRTLLWESLSQEAQYVANLVLHTPTEALEYLMASHDQVSRRRLVEYLLRQVKWPREVVRRTLDELRCYVNEFEE